MAPPNPFDDDNNSNNPTPTENGISEESTNHHQRPIAVVDDPTHRARRHREEAVSRLVADATRYDPHVVIARDDMAYNTTTTTNTPMVNAQQHSTNLLLASTIASSIERGLDRELHGELVRQGKEASEKISKICHDYSEEFLESVGKVVMALGGPCEEVRGSLEEVRRNTIYIVIIIICIVVVVAVEWIDLFQASDTH